MRPTICAGSHTPFLSFFYSKGVKKSLPHTLYFILQSYNVAINLFLCFLLVPDDPGASIYIVTFYATNKKNINFPYLNGPRKRKKAWIVVQYGLIVIVFEERLEKENSLVLSPNSHKIRAFTQKPILGARKRERESRESERSNTYSYIHTNLHVISYPETIHAYTQLLYFTYDLHSTS